MFIEDGIGSGNKAAVNSSNQLLANTVVVSALHEAAMRGDAYSWTAVTADIDAADTALLVCNDSRTKLLVIEKVYCWADVATAIQIHCPVSATWDGTAVVGVPLNRAINTVAEATAKCDDEQNALVAAQVVITVQTNELATDQFATMVDLNGAVILGKDDAIAVDVVVESTAFNCTIIGYYIPIE